MEKHLVVVFLIFVKVEALHFNKQFFPFGKIPPFGAYYPYRIDHPIMPRGLPASEVSK